MSQARLKIPVCGRRFGKSGLSKIAVVRGHGPRDAFLPGLIHGARIYWVAPIYKQTNRPWVEFKEMLRPITRQVRAVDREIHLINGGMLAVRSADQPDTLRGDGLDGAVLDEAAYMDPATWPEVIRPSLSDRMGWCLMPTTPDGHNWLYDEFEACKRKASAEAWQLPTSLNPLIPREDLAEARLDLGPQAYAQEYEAQFVQRRGAEWPAEYFGEHAWFDEWPADEDTFVRVLSLDPSSGKNQTSDFQAYVMAVYARPGLWYIDADIARTDYVKLIEKGQRIASWFRPHVWAIETNKFEGLKALAYQMFGGTLPYIADVVQHTDKVERIKNELTPLLARQLIRFKRNSPGAKLLVQQMRDFPIGDFDDGPDAFATALPVGRAMLNQQN